MAHSAVSRSRALILPVAIALCCGLAVLTGLMTGPVPVSLSELLETLLPGAAADSVTYQVVHELRIPRVSGAFAIGASLAVAGAMLQILLRNPLADPYILGTAGGAAAGALGAILAGLGSLLVNAAALTGALCSTLLVFWLGFGRAGFTPLRLLLTGVVVAAGWNAAISFLLVSAASQDASAMLFWLLGDLQRITDATAAWWTLAIGLLVGMAMARSLNVLRQGELSAQAVGVPVVPLRLVLFTAASLLTATAVTLAGAVGFVGLLVPHALRLLGVKDHRTLLPAAAGLGGAVLVAADTLSRMILAPQQLPVGVLTAALGVPVFLILLHRTGRA